jgi:TetR/AcrR family transcriptional repressor of nem operon
MARPVEYDLDNVLDNAMELFWQKGYENVSMADLVEHTTLNRRTMYSLFKDKEGIFKDALDNYYLKRSSKVIGLLKDNPGKKGIELFLTNFTFNDKFKGCLFNNCMGKGEFMSTAAYEIPKSYFENLRLQIERNLEVAKLNGEFTSDVKTMALTIITIVHGFNIYGKYNHSKDEGMIIMRNILNMIR